MNDRLADLGDDVPAWALDSSATTPTAGGGTGGYGASTDGDVELGSMPMSSSYSPQHNHHQNGVAEAEAPSWMNAADDFQNNNNTMDSNDNQQQETNQSELIMTKFFQNVDHIKSTIDHISASTQRIKRMEEKTVLSNSEMEEKKMSQEIKSLIQETNIKAKNGKKVLSLLREENKEYEENKVINVSDLRKRENLVNTLTRKFIDEMKEYQNTQQSYKVIIQKRAVQQIKYVKEDATPEEVEEIMKSEGGREGLYQQSILQGGVNESIKQTYTKVAGKYQDILALEQSVAELHQMFLDFALLTEQQGELIDQIEFNVKSAADYVEDANVDVHHAIESSKSIRKKQCMIIVIVIVVTIILLFSFRILP